MIKIGLFWTFCVFWSAGSQDQTWQRPLIVKRRVMKRDEFHPEGNKIEHQSECTGTLALASTISGTFCGCFPEYRAMKFTLANIRIPNPLIDVYLSRSLNCRRQVPIARGSHCRGPRFKLIASKNKGMIPSLATNRWRCFRKVFQLQYLTSLAPDDQRVERVCVRSGKLFANYVCP